MRRRPEGCVFEEGVITMASPPFTAQWHARTTYTFALLRRPCAAIFLLVVILVTAACGGASGSASGSGSSSTPQVIKIGSIHPLTGALAGDGKQMDEAVKMAIDDINASGGIKSLGGARLAIDSVDTQGDPNVAQSEAQRLVNDGVAAMVGTYQSDATAEVAKVAERARIPLVIDVTAADDIMQQGYRFSFRIQPNATAMGTYGARYLKAISDAAGSPVKTVAYIHEGSDFGTSVFKAFQAEAAKEGIQVVKEIKYNAFNVSDLTLELTQLKAANPDVIAATGYYKDSLLVAQNAAAVMPHVKAMYGVANGAFDLPQFPKDAGKAGSFYFSSNYHWNALSSDANKIRSEFQAKYNDEMRTPAVFSYVAVQVIANALERARSTDAQALRNAIAQTSLNTSIFPFSGPIEFDSHGENKNAQPILMQVQNGNVMQVYPDQYAQAKPIFPATPWSGGTK
jgi:branched-chain amino acid transport system substrate-binding protein